MAEAAEATNVGPIALVAIEQFYPASERVVEDPMAYTMLPPASRVFVNLMRSRFMRNAVVRLSEKSQPGIWGGLLCRKRYIDDKLVEFSAEVDAVVNLGAGLDTRSIRLEAVSGKTFWEVDQPRTIALKAQRLRKAVGAVPKHLQLVSIDFDHDDLATILLARGYRAGYRTFFIMEAVTQYLTEAGVRATLASLGTASAGSRLVFTYVRKDFLDGSNRFGWDSGYTRFVKGGLWHFGIDPNRTAALLREYGWRLEEDFGYDALAARFLAPVGRGIGSTPVERVAYAVRQAHG